MADASVKIRGGAGNATQLQSRDIDSAAPADTNVLAWSASDSEWEPTAAGGGVTSEWTDTGTVLHPSEETVDNVVVGGTTTANSDIILGVDGHAVFNEQGSDVDFRVEASGEANALVVQGSDGHVGIGILAPNADLHVNGASPKIALGSTTSGDPRFDFYKQNTTEVVGSMFLDQSASDDGVLKILRTASGSANDGIVINDDGDVGIGTITPDSLLEISKSEVAADTEVLISSYYDVEAITPKITFRKADGSEGSPALVDDNAVLGTIDFLGHDGGNFERGAKIEARVQGTSASNDLPTELTFWTTPDGSNTAAERMSIGADGAVALKALAASPSATADYAKIYSLDDGNPATTPEIRLLCNFNTAIEGDSQYEATFTTGGSPIIDTSVWKFGDGSCKFISGDSDYINTTSQFATIKDFSGAMTWDWWVYFSTLSSRTGMISSSAYDDFVMEMTASNVFRPGYRESGSQYWNVTGDKDDFETGTWYHLAWVKDASHNMYTFVDGALDGSNTSSKTGGYVSTSTSTNFGKAAFGGGYFFNGNLDSVRYTSYARWSGAGYSIGDQVFTPPTAENEGETQLYALDSYGNHTKLSPHRNGRWEFYSKDQKTGRVVRIDMESVVEDLGELTGKDYIKDK